MGTNPVLNISGGNTPVQNFMLGELFSGAGGTAWAAHTAKYNGNGFSHAWANDNNHDACETLKLNIPSMASGVICCDIKKIEMKNLADIDGLVFGFPCNDFSIVGDRKGIAGQYGSLYQRGRECLEAKRPLFFIAENVSGLASSNDDFDVIIQALEDSGYNVSYKLFRFEEYGVPQTRHRFIFIGFRKDLGNLNFQYPLPITKDKPNSCREALDDIAPNALNNELPRHTEHVIERLKHIRPGQNAFNADLPDHLKFTFNCKATISQIYKRLKPDEPAYTVTGSGGGGTHMYHWEENRALTNRERAKLQTFPDNYEFVGGIGSVRRQIGMAVPPEGARHIFNAVLKTLDENGISSEC